MERAVLHVLEALEGGTARHVVDLVRHTPGWRHHVAIPTKRVGAPTDIYAAGHLHGAGAAVHFVEMRRSPPSPGNLVALGRLVRLIRMLEVSLVHTHSSVGGALGRLASALARRPAVYTPHALARGRTALAIERALGPLASRVIALSPSEFEMVRGLRLVPDHRVVMIPNGIETEMPGGSSPDVRALIGAPANAPLVGTIGRLINQKAPERFVRMAARVAATDGDTHFLLIGEGPLRDLVDIELAGTGLNGRFHHLDVLPDAGSVLGQFDIFVLTSRFEGGPYAPLEAMRAGIPVVLTDVVGSRDAVDSTSGVLVAELDESALADSVSELLADPGRRAALGAAGRQRVRTHFDVRTMGTSIATLYDEVVAETSPPCSAGRRAIRPR